MKRPLLLLGVSLLPCALPAQTITITANAITSFTPNVSISPLTATQLQPAGPLAPVGFLNPQVSSGSQSSSAQLAWAATADTTSVRFRLEAGLNVQAFAPSFADSSLCEVLVSFQASSPVNVYLVATSSRQLATGSSVLQDRVDVNNDGTFEILETGPYNLPLGPLAIGTQPLLVRFKVAFSQTGPGLTSIARNLELLPANDLAINYVFPGCDTFEDFLVRPTFADSGIELTAFVFSPFAVGVLGLGFQPVQLPTSLPSPCLLIPSPDVLLLLPPQQPVHVPLPAALRPVAFWAQGVAPLGLGPSLGTSNAFSVLAF